MNKIRGNIAFKTMMWVLLVATVFVTIAVSWYAGIGMEYKDAENWQNTSRYHSTELEYRREVENLLYKSLLLQNSDLDYAAEKAAERSLQKVQKTLDKKNTNFRYEVRNEDGSRVLFTNLPRGENLQESVYEINYSTINPVEFYGMGNEPTTSTETEITLEPIFGDASDFIIEALNGEVEYNQNMTISYGVPLEMRNPADDAFLIAYTDFVNAPVMTDGNIQLGIFFFVAMILFALLCLSGILWSGGYHKGAVVPTPIWQDEIWLEVMVLLSCVLSYASLFGMVLTIRYGLYSTTREEMPNFGWMVALAGTAIVVVGALTLRTLVVRIRCRVFWKHSVIFKCFKYLYDRCTEVVMSIHFTWRMLGGFLMYISIRFLVGLIFYYAYPIPLFVVDIMMFLLIARWAIAYCKVAKGSEALSQGNLAYRIDTQRMPYDLQKQAEHMNNISLGMSAAVEEQMKSERFKAELITNVSHDLKTPLTSIINYVDLLKATEQTDVHATEYIEVLERKAQRLKKLTEDLVEASKASTGTLSVNCETISIPQLLDQAMGEFEEKLADRGLSIVTTIPEGDSFVYADGRHLWRVLDNLLSNCMKYAMEGTRVYIELERGHGQVILSIKNISHDPLNVPAEQLLERFVRGEDSRSSEGSGLGLSIAKSLTELQGGTFDLIVDGDLFKAVISLPQAK